MSTTTLLELLSGFAAACFALWFVAVRMPSSRSAPLAVLTVVAPAGHTTEQRLATLHSA